MKHGIQVDIDLERFVEPGVTDARLESWYAEHEDEFTANVSEYVSSELKYYLREIYPIEEI